METEFTPLSDEEKILHMYCAIEPDTSEREMSRLVVERETSDDWNSPLVLRYMKNGDTCWTMTQAELLFEYITKDWAAE